VVLVCGSNIDMNVLSRLLERDMAERGRLLNIRVSVPDRPGSLHFTTGIVARAGANILHVLHDRSFSREPSNVDITLELEVRNKAHKETLLQELAANGIEAQVTD
jgi:threonine dehydratase